MNTWTTTLAVVGIVEVAFLTAAIAATLRLQRSIRPFEGLQVVYEDDAPEIE